MEKATVKSKNKILNLLPKVAQASVSFQSPPPFSPAGRAKWPDLNVSKLRAKINKSISGQVVSMIPVEARRNSKNSETQEPTSPKVSCMGQIKHRNKICKSKQVSLQKVFDNRPVSSPGPKRNNKTRPDLPVAEPKKKPEGIRKVFSARRRSDASIDHDKQPQPDRAPSLSQMRRFASSRDTFANFDWTTSRIAPEELDVDFNSEEERGHGDDEYDAVKIIPLSAAMLVSGSGAVLTLEPRKEINLWKRRTMAKPKPLQLNLIRAQ
ncbi:hypothetical protein F511_00972 [Dorcoceras hygrometricum]|uniref:Uncharacterized protein n=1 Tax=Dorcoceras hygrometricum TaxID=472368 RepID=A0A2Z7AEF2_9LAMI|nr:hypothetical protein F511_00972 [Dorcoceras hygrometricum]